MNKEFLFGFLLGIFILGFVIVMMEPTPKPKEISYTQLEKDLDKAQCQVEKIEAILAERIRLTGKVNP